MRRTGSARWPPALVLLAIAACTGESASADRPAHRELAADHVALDMATDIRERGALRARIHGDTVYSWEAPGRMLFFPLEVELFDASGAPTGRLTAAEGEYDPVTKATVARGDAVLVSVDGDRLLTEELHYDPESGRLWSDVRTVLVEEGTRLEGTGFRADDALTEVVLVGSTGERTDTEPGADPR